MMAVRWLFLGVFGILLSVCAAPGETDAVVGSVDGEPITLGDVLAVSARHEEPLYAALSGKELENAVRERRMSALNELIDRKLILADYERNPFTIPAQYVESMIDDFAQNSGVRSRREFAIRARETGSSLEELTKMARERLIVQAMLSREYQVQVNVTPAELYRTYEERRKKLGTPEIWRLSMIRIDAKRPDHDSVLKLISDRLAGGSPMVFAELAAQYSSGVNAAVGGELGNIPRSDLRKEFAEAIKVPKAGGVYGPIATPEGEYFLLLHSITAATVPDFQQMEPLLRETLEAAARKSALEKYVKRLRAQSIIQIFL